MSNGIKLAIFFVGLVAAALWLRSMRDSQVTAVSATAAALAQTPSAAPSCNVTRITIKDLDGGFVDECSRTPCPSFRGTGTLTNTCDVPIGVQLKITAFDSVGKPIQTRELWPASTRNIPPGDYVFSMDAWLDPDDRIEQFEVEPVDVNTWR